VPRFRLLLEYNGTRYSGWQVQKNARTVQGELIRAAREVTRRDKLELYGAGRTDAGVHAIGQVAHLDVATTLPPRTLLDRMNEALPADINVLDVRVATHRFHARHDAIARRYVYRISRRRTAFAKPFVWWVREPLDVGAMREAAGTFVGLHDFEAFSDDEASEKSTKVQVDEVAVVEAGALVLVRVTGSHFLWRMVRRLVGVLVGVGAGRLAPRDMSALMHGTGELPARLTAPSAGLFLEAVLYPGEQFADEHARDAALLGRVAARSPSGLF
jgi:tRNA pseudouridine38-40 synthase